MGIFSDLEDAAGDVVSSVGSAASDIWTQVNRPRFQFLTPSGQLTFHPYLASTEQAQQFANPVGIFQRAVSAPGLALQAGAEQGSEALGSPFGLSSALRSPVASTAFQVLPWVAAGVATGGLADAGMLPALGQVGVRTAAQTAGIMAGSKLGGEAFDQMGIGRSVGEILGGMVGGGIGDAQGTKLAESLGFASHQLGQTSASLAEENLASGMAGDEAGQLAAKDKMAQAGQVGGELGQAMNDITARTRQQAQEDLLTHPPGSIPHTKAQALLSEDALAAHDYTTNLKNTGDPGLVNVDPIEALNSALNSAQRQFVGPKIDTIYDHIPEEAITKGLSADKLAAATYGVDQQMRSAMGLASAKLGVTFEQLGLKPETPGGPLSGIAAAADGTEPTFLNVAEYPDKFALSPEVRGLVDAFNTANQRIYEGAHQMLIDRFGEAEADRLMPKTALQEGQNYVPRVDREQPMARLGRLQPNVAKPRTMDTPNTSLFLDNPGAIHAAFGQQVARTIEYNMFVKPALRAMGAQFEIPPEIEAAVATARDNRSWGVDVNKFLDSAKRGSTSAGRLWQRYNGLLDHAPQGIDDAHKMVLQAIEDPLRRMAQLSRDPNVKLAPSRYETALGNATGDLLSAEPNQPFLMGDLRYSQMDAAQRSLYTEMALKDARTATTAAAKDAMERWKPIMGIHQNDFLNASNVRDNLAGALANAEGLRGLPFDIFPGLQGTLMDQQAARQLTDAFRKYGPAQPGIIQKMTDLTSPIKTSIVGMTGGHLILHLMPIATTQPWLLPKIAWQMLTDDNYALAMNGFANRTLGNGKSVLQNMADTRTLLLSDELTDPSLIMSREGISAKIADLTNKLPTNRWFARSVSLGRANEFEFLASSAERLRGTPLTPVELEQIGKIATNMTGGYDWLNAGIGTSARSAANSMMFAPSWLMANATMLARALDPHVSVGSLTAKAALAQNTAMPVFYYTALAQALGQQPILDPTDKHFLTIKAGDTYLGVPGPIVSLVRAVGTAYAQAESGRVSPTQAIEDSLHSFWRSHANPIAGLIHDVAIEHQNMFTGEQMSINNPLALAQTVGKDYLPLPLQAMMDNKHPGGATAEFLGVRTQAITPAEKFTESADARAKTLGYSDWNSVPAALKNSTIQADPELKDLNAQLQDYYAKFKTPEAQMVDNALTKNRAAVEAGVISGWTAVQNGTMDLATFRKALNNSLQQYAVGSNALLTALPDKSPAKTPGNQADALARVYYAIQPQEDAMGQVSQAAWDQWRQQRADFFKQYPDAAQYRDYILTDYPTRNWGPTMGAILKQRDQVAQLYGDFLQLPKYQGMSVKEAELVDKWRGLKQDAVNTLANQAGAQGVYPNYKALDKYAWQYVFAQMQNDPKSMPQNEREMQLLQAAVYMDQNSKARMSMLSPERVQFLKANPLLVQWYPNTESQAGLNDFLEGVYGLPQTGGNVPQTLSEAQLIQSQMEQGLVGAGTAYGTTGQAA